MDSMKKFRIGSGLQNFHIRSPLIQPYIAYSFYNSLWHHHPDCHASCWLIFLLCVCFASIYASTAAKSYILDYMRTAANFIIEGRMGPYGRRLCIVVVEQGCASGGPGPQSGPPSHLVWPLPTLIFPHHAWNS